MLPDLLVAYGFEVGDYDPTQPLSWTRPCLFLPGLSAECGNDQGQRHRH